MKKILLATLSFLLVGGAIAQNNLFEEFKKYENEEFKMYKYWYHSTEKVFKIKPQTYSSTGKDYNNFVIFIQKNEFGKPMDLDIQEKGESNSPKEYKKSFRHTTYDHYSEPAYISSDINGADTYVMIDGLLFQIKKGNEDMSSFGYGNVFVPMSLMDGEKNSTHAESGKKKKMSLKEKLEAKAGKLYGIKPLPEVLKAIETKEVYKAKINDYILSMRTKQAKTPLTAQDKKEIAAMEKLATDEKNKIKKANSDYWNSEEGQRVLAKDKSSTSTYTIKNTTGKSIKVGNGNGSSYQLSNGSTYNVNCGSPIYIMELNESKTTWRTGSLISDGKNVCGKTITF